MRRVAATVASIAALAAPLALSAPAAGAAPGVATTTIVSMPNAMAAGTATPLTVTVVAAAGSTAPTGTVTARVLGAGVIGTATLAPVAGPWAAATIPWTIAPLGEYRIQVSFTPAGDFAPSTSVPIGTTVQAGEPATAIVLPSQLAAGVGTTVTVLAPTAPLGSTAAVTLQTLGPSPSTTSVSGSRALMGGRLAVTFVPPRSGAMALTVQWSSPDGTASGSATQSFVVG